MTPSIPEMPLCHWQEAAIEFSAGKPPASFTSFSTGISIRTTAFPITNFVTSATSSGVRSVVPCSEISRVSLERWFVDRALCLPRNPTPVR